MEVRFSSEKEVFDLVYYGVKTALNTKDISAVLEESKKVNKDFWNRVEKSDKSVQEHFEEIVNRYNRNRFKLEMINLPRFNPGLPDYFLENYKY